ncbi:MAG: PAS domain-containing protein, partial [Rhodospirillales bacterium]|nr:PAS domain-containing protein [Rhodospirillales bacterium]
MTDPSKYNERRLLSWFIRHTIAIPVLAALIMFIIVVMAWLLVKNDHAARINADTHSNTEYLAARLETHIATRLDIAEHIQNEWLAGRINNKEEFLHIANTAHEFFGDFQAISWVDPNGVIRWVTPIEGNEAVQGLDLKKLAVPKATLENAERTGLMQITPPIKLAQGGNGFVAYVPLIRNGVNQGFLNIVFRTTPIIYGAFREGISNQYHLNVKDGEATIYDLKNVAGVEKNKVQKQIKVGNRKWTVTLMPTAPHLEESSTYTDEFVLVIGLLISAYSAFMIRLVMARQKSLHESEERFKQAERITKSAHWITDTQMKSLLHTSDNAEVLFGMPPNDYIGDLSFFESNIHSEDHKRIRKVFNDLPSNPRPYQIDYRYQRDDGKLIWVRETGEPFYNSAGVYTGFRGASQDVTVLKEAEQASQIALQEAEHANQAKSEFLATMSHEFRTPLNAILGFSEMMRAQYFGPLGANNYKEYAKDIHDSGVHMMGLVNDVLDIAAIEAGKRAIVREEIYLEEILQDCVKNVDHIADEREIDLSLDTPENLPILFADKRSVIQIILNLLSNAIKFTERNGDVKISASTLNQCMMIEVRDTGIGIPPEKLPDITEPFAQAHSNPHIAQEGTGLGLSIVKALADTHDAKLTI